MNHTVNQSADFETVTRYVCRFCSREFKTPTRHQCKYNPKFKNCFSCANSTEIHWIDDTGRVIAEQEAAELNFIGCNKVFSCTCGGDEKMRSITKLSARQWNSDCRMWQTIPGYTGKDSFLRKMWGIQTDLEQQEGG